MRKLPLKATPIRRRIIPSLVGSHLNLARREVATLRKILVHEVVVLHLRLHEAEEGVVEVGAAVTRRKLTGIALAMCDALNLDVPSWVLRSLLRYTRWIVI